MVSIARKNLFQEKTRLLISVGGVAFAVLLISILLGLYEGILVISGSYISGTSADVWVMQEGASDMFHSFSLLPSGTRDRLLQIGGVERAYGLVTRNIEVPIKGENVSVYLIGYDTSSGVGGPVKIFAGKDTVSGKEIIIDRVFASKHGFWLNDKIEFRDEEYKVVGISEGGNMMLYQFAFISKEAAEELLDQRGFVNFVLLSLKSPRSAEKVSKKIKDDIPQVSAFPRDEFVVKNRKTIAESFVPIIGVLVAIAFIVGLVIIGLTIYTATVEKIREYGVLKAIGATNPQLYGLIFEQALTSALLGFIAGIGLLYLFVRAIDTFAPEFPVYFKPAYLAAVFFAVVLMSLFASYIPVRRVARVDPAIVFKA